MSVIKYNSQDNTFNLTTKNTAYSFKVVNNKYLAHLNYGDAETSTKEYVARPLAFASYAEDGDEKFYFETAHSEYPLFGSGDFGADAIRIRNSKGNNVTYFEYQGYEIIKGRVDIKNLPCAYVDDSVETLVVTLYDEVYKVKLKLCYSVYFDDDVITRYAIIENHGNEQIFIENAKSLSVDIPSTELDVITLTGAHYYERTVRREKINVGKFSVSSARGTSSHHFNPFVAVCQSDTTFESGKVYGFNFVYSGSFENVIENVHDRVRVQVGINGAVEGCSIQPEETYYTPEAVMTYSKNGIGQMSRNFHSFIKKYIIKKENNRHPMVLNTWEAFYFDINEEKLLQLAEEASKVGIDTLVVDDGWFSIRNADNAGLGDWWVNTDKFPSGLKTFSEKITDKGLNLGIWIEPEMVNPDSQLFKNHPEWCLNAYNRPLSLSRNQLVLNMALPEVLDYLKEKFTKAFDGVKFNYIKWDMNRSLSMAGCNFAGQNTDNNLYGRFMEGVYDLHEWFNKTYPNVMIEGCSGGGGRYDIAMMRYVSQIWTSDNTFPTDRARIQNGSLIAYPSCMMSCHVSNPNDVLNDKEEMDYRFKVASAGVLGYEMDLISVSDAVKSEIKKQIEYYSTFKHVVLDGEFYPIYAKDETYLYYYYEKTSGDIVLFYATQKPCNKVVKFSSISDGCAYKLSGTSKSYSVTQLKEGFDINLDKKSDILFFKKIK